MSKNVCVCFFPSSTSLIYIALQPLGEFDLSLTSSTYLCHGRHGGPSIFSYTLMYGCQSISPFKPSKLLRTWDTVAMATVSLTSDLKPITSHTRDPCKFALAPGYGPFSSCQSISATVGLSLSSRSHLDLETSLSWHWFI